MIELEKATKHIRLYVIDNDDWDDSDDDKKRRLLNVAERTIKNWASENIPRLIAPRLLKPLDEIDETDYEVPDEAIFEMAATLARVFNETNAMQQQGIAGFSVTGVGSFTFKENNVTSAAGEPLENFITDEAMKYIEKANDIKMTGRTIKDVIL